MSLDRDGTALAAFIAGTMLAGGNAVGVRVSNRELDPLWGAGLRFLLAVCLLGAVMVVMRLTLPRGRALLGVVLYGALIFGGAFSFAYYALVRIHAGLGQTLLALVPLATLLLAVLQRQERLRLAAVVGTLLSIAGLGVISGLSGGESPPVLSLLAVLGAVLCFGAGDGPRPSFSARTPGDDERSGDGDGRLWSASRAVYTFVLIPLVTVLLSVWIDDEPIGAGLVLGGLLVLAGVYVGALRPAASPALQTQVERNAPE